MTKKKPSETKPKKDEKKKGLEIEKESVELDEELENVAGGLIRRPADSEPSCDAGCE